MTLVQLLTPLLVLAITFPYTQLVSVAGDSYTQPFAYILAAIAFFGGRRPFSYLGWTRVACLVGYALLGVVLLVTTVGWHPETQELKYLLSFVTPVVLVPALARILDQYPQLVRTTLLASIAVWCGVATMQWLFRPEFATGLVGHWGESASYLELSGRGVLGLAPEPTHHAFHVLILGACLALMDSSRRWGWVALVCAVDATMIAASSSAIAALLLSAVLLLAWRSPLLGLCALVVGVAVWSSLPPLLELVLGADARATRLATSLLFNPLDWLATDFSVNARLGGVYVVAVDVVQRWLVPAGLSWEGWLATRERALWDHRWLMGLSEVGPPSGILAIMYQGGVLALPFLLALFRPVLRLVSQPWPYQWLLVTAPLIFVGQYYLSAPTFSLLVAAAWWREHQSAERAEAVA